MIMFIIDELAMYNCPKGMNKVVLYCIVLYCIVLYCIVLYCIVLYCRLLSLKVIGRMTGAGFDPLASRSGSRRLGR